MPSLEIPEMPEGLCELAQQEWKAMVPQLETMGMISRIDGKALAAYCQTYARWIQAEDEVQRLGIMIEEHVVIAGEEIGSNYKRNPAIGISNEALKLMKSFLIEFGMTPASRSRIRIDKPKEDEDPFDMFLRRGSSTNEKLVN